MNSLFRVLGEDTVLLGKLISYNLLKMGKNIEDRLKEIIESERELKDAAVAKLEGIRAVIDEYHNGQLRAGGSKAGGVPFGGVIASAFGSKFLGMPAASTSAPTVTAEEHLRRIEQVLRG